ncbi:MAG: ABC transporter substrate binding protein [Candidatus Thiodiazotropha endolucinida]
MSTAELANPRQVLILNSYHSSMDWVVDIQRGVSETLRDQADDSEIFSEYMDTKRIPFTPQYEQQVRDFLHNKYAGRQFTTVLATDNNAFDFMRRHGEALFPGVPVVFCGINFFKDELLEGYPNFTGVTETYDAKGTLSLALALHPNTQQVLVINDHLPTGRATEAEIREQLSGMGLTIPVRYAEKMPITELEGQLTELPADSIVLLGNYYRDGLDHFIPPKESSRLISVTSKAPVYSMLEFRIGQGVVGGYAVSGYRQGRAAGRLMADILNGKPVSEIPVLKTGVNRLMFDSIQLDRFGIHPANLPMGSTQLNLDRALFTQQERMWLEQHPVIRIAPDPDFPPIEYFDDNGAYRGLAADYVRKLEERIGIRFDIVRLKNWDQAVAQAMKYGYNRFEWEHMKRDGTTFPVEVSLTRIPYRGRSAIFCMWNDITERKAAALEIQRLATHDALTGLASLRLAEDRIEMAIAKARRENCKMAVLFIDLDGFKKINDEYGHDAGDALLKEVAVRMSAIVREVDTVARIGGDEFLIILSCIATLADTDRVSAQLIQAVGQPCFFEGNELNVGVSVGVAFYPDHGDTRDALVRSADRAMYEVKRGGKNNFCVAHKV